MKSNTNHQNRLRASSVITAFSLSTVLLSSVPAAHAQCVLPPTGVMVAWYPLEEGGFSADLATRNNGTWSAPPPTPVGGKVGLALSFAGNNYVQSPDSILTNFGPAGTAPCAGADFSSCTGDFSIEAWVQFPYGSLPNQPEAIVDKRGPGPIGYSFYINDDRLGLQLADGTGPNGYDNYDSPDLRALRIGEGFHHVAVVVNRTSAIRWYLDGYLRGTTIPAHTSSLVNKAVLRIGANGPDNPGGFFNGYIDEVSIYNRALTTAEVKAVYNAGSNGKCKP